MKKTRVMVAAVLGTAAMLAACASGTSSMAGAIVAEAKDLPDHFMVSASGLSQMEEPKAGEGCRNPLIDPRNGTTLNLMRSKDGIGDYQVLGEQYALGSRYGVDPRHYLRLDCATGKALGIVDP
jgi:hypothetical protein